MAKEELLTELAEAKISIENNQFNLEQIQNSLLRIDSELINSNKYSIIPESNIIKSLFVIFNISNLSDFTVLFITSAENVQILESAGDELFFNEFKKMIDTEKEFYKNIDKIRIKGSSFRLFYESMENDNGIYTILTITESVYFKPSSFHMLSDILMDILRSTDMSENGVISDLFEDTIIGINSYIVSNDITNGQFYLFKFENIYDFFLKMGLEIIIELSETIKKRLTEFFGDKSAIFRFSLSEYIIISTNGNTQNNKTSDLNDSNILDFNYKGIVLKHRCIKIPYTHNQTVYDIFENIFLIDNMVKK